MTLPEIEIHKSTRICEKHEIAKYHPDCPRCDGEGEIEDYDSYEGHEFESCWQCNGTGIAPWLACEDCDLEAQDGEFD